MLVFTQQIECAPVERIVATVAGDREKGHFATKRRIPNWMLNKGFRKNLESIVLDGRRLDAQLKAALYIFRGDKSGNDLGFLIASQTDLAFPGMTRPFDELWVMAIFPEYRNRGFGRRMIAEYLRRARHNRILLARCFPASEVAKQIMLKAGFSIVSPADVSPCMLAYGSPPDKQQLIAGLQI